MATERFPAVQYFKVFEDDEEFLCGGISGQLNQQLAQIVFVLYKHGAHTGTERMRSKIYHDSALTKLYATSDWFDLADIDTNPGDGEVLDTYWRGRVAMTFASKPWLDSQSTYFVSMEIDNYTRNADTFYMAIMYDWPFPVNDNQNAISMEIYGYRTVNYF